METYQEVTRADSCKDGIRIHESMTRLCTTAAQAVLASTMEMSRADLCKYNIRVVYCGMAGTASSTDVRRVDVEVTLTAVCATTSIEAASQ